MPIFCPAEAVGEQVDHFMETAAPFPGGKHGLKSDEEKIRWPDDTETAGRTNRNTQMAQLRGIALQSSTWLEPQIQRQLTVNPIDSFKYRGASFLVFHLSVFLVPPIPEQADAKLIRAQSLYQ